MLSAIPSSAQVRPDAQAPPTADVASLRQAVVQQPDREEPHVLLVNALLLSGDLEGAESAANEGLQNVPTSTPLMALRGEALLGLGRLERALDAFRTARTLSRFSGRPRRGAGIAPGADHDDAGTTGIRARRVWRSRALVRRSYAATPRRFGPGLQPRSGIAPVGSPRRRAPRRRRSAVPLADARRFAAAQRLDPARARRRRRTCRCVPRPLPGRADGRNRCSVRTTAARRWSIRASRRRIRRSARPLPGPRRLVRRHRPPERRARLPGPRPGRPPQTARA